MKKYLFLMLALVTTLAFVGCNKDKEREPENTTEQGNREVVKTQFAISIPTSTTGKTRMDIGTVQGQSTPTFRGFDALYLFPSSTDFTGSTTGLTVKPLAGFTAFTDDQYKLYNDVDIPTGTKYFLLYGEATKETGEFVNGVLETEVASAISTADITFSLQTILPASSDYNTKAGELATYLSNIAKASVTTPASKAWFECDASSTVNVEKVLAGLYNNFITLHAGSAVAIKTVLDDLYLSLALIANTEQVNTDEAVFKALAIEIRSKIVANYVHAGTGSNAENLYWNKVDDSDIDIAMSTFPTNYKLPEGAAELSWVGSTATYKTPALGDKINPTTITYPASLYYRANTELWASPSVAAFQWPVINNWDNPTAWVSSTNPWEGWGEEVITTTRKIALKKSAQYAVALLESCVRFNATTVKDKNDNDVTIDASGFPVTGMLIGGQPQTANWEFFPAAETFDYTIYDKEMNGGAAMVAKYIADADNFAGAPKNYTLVLDNKKSGADQNQVYVAIELVNNLSESFYGVDGNEVRPGMKFYLIGLLNPTGTGVTNGENMDPQRVFAQDHKTVAKFTVKSLANAYVTIPDLRSTMMQLGLSVDLEWQVGMSFEVNID